MAINLVETLLQKLSPDLVNAIGGASGDSPASAERTAKAAVPTLLAGIVQQGSTEGGALRILEIMKASGHDGSGLSEYAAKLGDQTSRTVLMEHGTKLCTLFFGKKTEGVLDALAGQTGGKRSTSAGVLCLLAPYVLGSLGKHVKETGTDARGLAGLLSSQTGTLAALLPPGLARILGMERGVPAGAAPAASTYSPVTREPLREVSEPPHDGDAGEQFAEKPPTEKKPKRSWALPLWLGAAAIVAGLLAYRGARTPALPKVPSTEQPPAVGGGPAPAVPGVEALEAYLLAPGKAGQIASFHIEGLTFPTASAELEPASKASVDRMAKVMHDLPKVRVRVEGHTDNQGDPAANRALSEARATSVKKALAAKGVDPSRVEAAGYGSDRPIAPNDTAEGRAKNRRIDVLILER